MDIPKLGFGTYKLKGKILYDVLNNALALGYRHIDTASLYRNEEIIGNVLMENKIKREEIFLTTKISLKDIKKGKNGILNSIEKSLKKLQVEYIDLLLFHAPIDDLNIININWKLLEEICMNHIPKLKDKIKNIGVSNYNINHLQSILNDCKIKPFCNQIEISPFLTRDNLVSFCNQNNIKIIAHSSLTKGTKFNDNKLMNLSIKYNLNIPLLLLCWAKYKNFILIPRTSNIDHVLQNLDCLKINLSTEAIKELDELNENYSTHPKFI